MPRARAFLWILAAAAMATATILIIYAVRARRPAFITGAVLAQDADPRKQAPISNVKITAVEGDAFAESISDVSGFFRLNLPRTPWKSSAVTLTFQHADYKPLEVTGEFANRINIIRMAPLLAPAQPPRPASPESVLADVRVRYAMKSLTAVNVGSMARAFEVVNTGDVPCDRKLPCSPDGKWKATLSSETFDAGEGHQFSNTRLSCIAGPCPFTRIDSDRLSDGGRRAHLSVLNWSDTATFLFEAEVIEATPSDAIRQLYPAIFGRNMNFTLPAGAQGPSIEADLNGTTIVFPLGPSLNLSWAACNLQLSHDKTKLYSCELKPGYRFR